MSDAADKFSNLYFVLQYMSKDGGGRWINMAAFDTLGPAEQYFREQNHDPDWRWKYRLMDLENECCIAATPPTVLQHQSGGEK